MPHAVEIGRTEEGAAVRLDIPTLIETRLLTTAQSGGGKSWTLRRLLEQSHGQVQQIVIDLEGEFPSLREHGDYVLIGKGGDRAAHPREAQALARSALELQFSVIVDLSELEVPDRRRYVRAFLESLVNSPRKLWHPVLVVVDEAHQFCPQGQKSESAAAVVDLLARGRKRGLCAVLATQRLAKLDKDAAAECGNVLVGRTVMDVDRARAIDALAIVSRADKGEISKALMTLKAGAFYSAGVAFSPDTLTFLRVGSVETKHPQIGRGQMAAPAPPPSAKVQAVLAKLDHISREEQEQANERDALRTRVGELTREVKRLEREVADRPVQQVGITDAELAQRITDRDHEWQQRLANSAAYAKAVDDLNDRMRNCLRGIARVTDDALDLPDPDEVKLPTLPALTARQSPPKPVIARRGFSPPQVDQKVDSGDYRPRAGARRMLEALARYHLGSMTPSQLRTFARLRKSGTSDTYLSELKRHGLVDDNGSELRITQGGLDMIGARATQPLTASEIIEEWRQAFRAGARRMLDALVDDVKAAAAQGRECGMTREELVEAAGMKSAQSGTFSTYLGELKRNGLAVESGGLVRLAEELR